jgi:hypothetical protein
MRGFGEYDMQTRLFSRYQRPALIVGVIALALALVGAFLDLQQFWRSYLLAYIFWLQIALGCLGMVMLHHLAGGRWSERIRHLMETGAMTLPLLAILFLPLIFGLAALYPWADAGHVAGSELLSSKSAYLNVPFFLARAAIYLIAWLALAFLLSRGSAPREHAEEDPSTGVRLRRISAFGIIVYMLTATFAAYDWMMSLEPEWFSSAYGLIFIAGQALAALALAIIGLRLIAGVDNAAEKREGVIDAAGWTQSFNDLGNFLLGFVMLWAYITFSQFLIIWSANLPEEAVWYWNRSRGGWLNLGMLLIAIHFVIPFFLLLSRSFKRRAQALTLLAVLILVARIVDLIWLIVPAFHPEGIRLHWLDLVIPVAMGIGWLALFARQWSRRTTPVASAVP